MCECSLVVKHGLPKPKLWVRFPSFAPVKILEREMSQKQIERQSLIVSAGINGLMAVAGIVIFFITGLQSLFLDAFFSFFSFLSNITALVFSKISKKRNASYPTGMYFLEPLYGLIKSLLIFALLIYSTIETSTTAFRYFSSGTGSPIDVNAILIYTLIMVFLCFGLAMFNKEQNKKINNSSTMLTAEYKSNLVDGTISIGIAALSFVLLFIKIDGALGFLHYIGDFFITIILVIVSIKQPIQLFAMSIRELSGATIKDKEIKKTVRKIMSNIIKEEDLDNKFEIYKTGMHIKVVILLEDNIEEDILKRLKTEALADIKESFDNVSIEYVFRKF